MTLDEAIKELKELARPYYPDESLNALNAIKLGIEALKWRQLMETDYGAWCGPPLPGETKE